MPARDKIHDGVKQSLINDGWIVIADPLVLDEGSINFFVDLGAEKFIVAQRSSRKIAVEIKDFSRRSPISDFHQALGQYINYRMILRQLDPECDLYFGISDQLYGTFFQTRFAQNAILESQLKLIVCDLTKQEIVKWID